MYLPFLIREIKLMKEKVQGEIIQIPYRRNEPRHKRRLNDLK